MIRTILMCVQGILDACLYDGGIWENVSPKEIRVDEHGRAAIPVARIGNDAVLLRMERRGGNDPNECIEIMSLVYGPTGETMDLDELGVPETLMEKLRSKAVPIPWETDRPMLEREMC